LIDLSKFKEARENIKACVAEFNRQYKEDPDTAMKRDYIRLWKDSKDKQLTALDWKQFYTHPEVQQFYRDELNLVLQSRSQTLARLMGENNSTATVQGLSAILNRLEGDVMEADKNKIFIYSVIPVNNIERNLENVQILKNIPEGIARAITTYEGNISEE
jgi:hypothetical protein